MLFGFYSGAKEDNLFQKMLQLVSKSGLFYSAWNSLKEQRKATNKINKF